MRIAKFTIALFFILILSLIFYFNLSLYYSPALVKENGVNVNEDLVAELRSLKEIMNRGGARDMQRLFPEGYVYMNAIYALAWADLIDPIKDDQGATDLYLEASREIDTAYRNIDSDEGRSVFSKELSLPYGAFYNGWRNYILGRKLEIERAAHRKVSDEMAFRNYCDSIASAIATEQNYLASYPFGTWPTDEVMCVASLAIHDRLYTPLYDTIINNWVQKVKGSLDANGLIPHQVDARSGEIIDPARGSSMSFMLIFLKDIDREFASDQFETYKKHFLDFRFGLPGVLEYPKGTTGYADVDSGPVILKMGASATIVGLRAFSEFDEESISVGIRNGIESFGVTFTWNVKKNYLFVKFKKDYELI
jgi:hypothetical protein